MKLFGDSPQALCSCSVEIRKTHLNAAFLDTFGPQRAKILLALGAGCLLLTTAAVFSKSQLWIIQLAMFCTTVLLAAPMTITLRLLWRLRKPVCRELSFFENGLSEAYRDGSAEWIPYANIQKILSNTHQIILCTKLRRISVDPNRFTQGSWEEAESLILTTNPHILRKKGCFQPWYVLIFAAWVIIICTFYCMFPWESMRNDPRIRAEDGWYEMTPGWGCEDNEPQTYLLEAYDYMFKNNRRKTGCSTFYRDDDFSLCLAYDLEHVESPVAFVAIKKGRQWRCIEMENLTAESIPCGLSVITIYHSESRILAVFQCSQEDSFSVSSEYRVCNLFEGATRLTDGVLILPAGTKSFEVSLNGTTLEIQIPPGD